MSPTPSPQTEPSLRPCRVVCVHVDGDELLVLLATPDGDVPVTVPLPRHGSQILHHVAALNGNALGCRMGLGAGRSNCSSAACVRSGRGRCA